MTTPRGAVEVADPGKDGLLCRDGCKSPTSAKAPPFLHTTRGHDNPHRFSHRSRERSITFWCVRYKGWHRSPAPHQPQPLTTSVQTTAATAQHHNQTEPQLALHSTPGPGAARAANRSIYVSIATGSPRLCLFPLATPTHPLSCNSHTALRRTVPKARGLVHRQSPRHLPRFASTRGSVCAQCENICVTEPLPVAVSDVSQPRHATKHGLYTARRPCAGPLASVQGCVNADSVAHPVSEAPLARKTSLYIS